MSAYLEELAKYYEKRGNAPRAGLYASLAAEEKAIGGPHELDGIAAPSEASARLHPSLEGKVRMETLTIGGKSKEELLRELRQMRVNISSYAQSMVESADFTTLPEPQQRNLVIARVSDLVPNPKRSYATTEEIWTARNEKGLDAVSAETALHYLIQKGNELQIGDAIWMSMKTIVGRDGDPSVFEVGCDDDGLWLDGGWAGPSGGWDPGFRVAFGLPQVNNA